MDAIQRKNTYHAKCIMDLNQEPDAEFEEKFSDLRIKDLLMILQAFPEDFLNLAMKDFEEMVINGTAGAFIEGTCESLTEEQEAVLVEACKVFFS